MPRRLLLSVVILLSLVAPLTRAADSEPVPYAPAWLQALRPDPAFDPVLPLLRQGQPDALKAFLAIATENQRAFRDFCAIDDDLKAALVADLDRLDQFHAVPRDQAITLVNILGPRRPEGIRLILRAANDPATSPGGRAIALGVADEFFDRPTDDPAILTAFADAFVDPTTPSAAVALRHPHRDDADVQRALAGAWARAVALGRRPNLPPGIPPAMLVPACRTALVSAADDRQRLRMLVTVAKLNLLDGLDDDHPLVLELARLTATPQPTPALGPVPRMLLDGQLRIASKTDAPGADEGPDDTTDEATVSASLARLKSNPRAVARTLVEALRSPSADARLATLKAFEILAPVDRAGFAPIIASTLAGEPDAEVRRRAAAIVGDDRSQALARVPGLIADLRADSPTLRETAARQLHELKLFPEPLTAALLRAVATRDMPAREGLLLALERAHAARSDPVALLRATAADADDTPDLTTRAYARAALRQLDIP